MAAQYYKEKGAPACVFSSNPSLLRAHSHVKPFQTDSHLFSSNMVRLTFPALAMLSLLSFVTAAPAAASPDSVDMVPFSIEKWATDIGNDPDGDHSSVEEAVIAFEATLNSTRLQKRSPICNHVPFKECRVCLSSQPLCYPNQPSNMFRLRMRWRVSTRPAEEAPNLPTSQQDRPPDPGVVVVQRNCGRQQMAPSCSRRSRSLSTSASVSRTTLVGRLLTAQQPPSSPVWRQDYGPLHES